MMQHRAAIIAGLKQAFPIIPNEDLKKLLDGTAAAIMLRGGDSDNTLKVYISKDEEGLTALIDFIKERQKVRGE